MGWDVDVDGLIRWDGIEAAGELNRIKGDD